MKVASSDRAPHNDPFSQIDRLIHPITCQTKSVLRHCCVMSCHPFQKYVKPTLVSTLHTLLTHKKARCTATQQYDDEGLFMILFALSKKETVSQLDKEQHQGGV